MEGSLQAPALIVVVDDNPADVFLIEEALRSQGLGFELTSFQDGEKAVSALCCEGAEAARIPDLILLDLNMPRSEGLEVLKKIRQTDHLAKVPIAVLSASQSPRDREDVAAMGAARFVGKPTELAEFLLVVGGAAKELLAQRH